MSREGHVIVWVAEDTSAGSDIGRVLRGTAHSLVERGHALHVLVRSGSDVSGIAATTVRTWSGGPDAQPGLGDLVALQREVRANAIHFHFEAPPLELLAPARAIVGAIGQPNLVLGCYGVGLRSFEHRTHRAALRRVDRLVVLDGFSAGRVASAGAPAERISVLRPGPLSPVQERPLADRRLEVVSIGGLDKRSGALELIDAFEHVAETRPDWSLAILGDGPDRDEIEARLAASGDLSQLADRIELHPDAEDRERCDLVGRASVGVQAALGSTFPWELGELQAAGLACIAPDDPRSESLTEGGRAARLVRPGEARGLATALGQLMDDAPVRERLAQAGLRRVQAESWQVAAEVLEDCYR
jgi:glycosyltransferase involved in cell wall biosynthesis